MRPSNTATSSGSKTFHGASPSMSSVSLQDKCKYFCTQLFALPEHIHSRWLTSRHRSRLLQLGQLKARECGAGTSSLRTKFLVFRGALGVFPGRDSARWECGARPGHLSAKGRNSEK